MKIVSIQDLSCYGTCSQTIAMPLLNHLGHEVIMLPTTLLSTHTSGFKGYTFLPLEEEIKKILCHWQEVNLKFDGCLMGYIGSTPLIDTIRNWLVKENISFVYLDPVFGEGGKLYPGFDASYVDEVKLLIPYASIMSPNLTEACFLLGIPYKEDYSLKEIKEMLKNLSDLGVAQVVISGIKRGNQIINLFYLKEKDQFGLVMNEKSPNSYHGSGDAFSALVAGKMLNGMPLIDAIEEAAHFVKEASDVTDSKNHWYGLEFEKLLKK